jgi:hypothetical protein
MPIVFQESRTAPVYFSLSSSSLKIFPNPVHDFAIASISLNQSAHIKLIVCDQVGKSLQTITDGWASAGTHSFQFNFNRCQTEFIGAAFYRQ